MAPKIDLKEHARLNRAGLPSIPTSEHEAKIERAARRFSGGKVSLTTLKKRFNKSDVIRICALARDITPVPKKVSKGALWTQVTVTYRDYSIMKESVWHATLPLGPVDSAAIIRRVKTGEFGPRRMRSFAGLKWSQLTSEVRQGHTRKSWWGVVVKHMQRVNPPAESEDPLKPLEQLLDEAYARVEAAPFKPLTEPKPIQRVRQQIDKGKK